MNGRSRARLAETGSRASVPVAATALGTRASQLTDEVIVNRVRSGEPELYEILMRRYNQRVYRVARSIVRDEDEAEDVMQDAYVRAYLHLDQFEGRASFATWLTKIAVYEALARSKRARRFIQDGSMKDDAGVPSISSRTPTPEDALSQQELRNLLTAAIDALPPSHRLVFVLRQVEGMTTHEAAQCLEISDDNVKVRLHRARTTLKEDIDRRVGRHARELFAFHLSRCNRIVANVFSRLSNGRPHGRL